MGRVNFKPGNMLYPLPAVLISCADKAGNKNVFTVAWAGTICSDPAMVSISVRKERFSHHMIKETGEFAINLTTSDLAFATDWCGVKSGKNVDKFKEMNLTKEKLNHIQCPGIKESPVTIECKVREIRELGSHNMFIADVLSIDADNKYIDENGSFDITKCNLIAYANGKYFEMGKKVGTFGYSVKKNK